MPAELRFCHDYFGRGHRMGRLTYDSSLTIYFDDRTLAHLQAAIGVKLHTKECFYLSWRNDHEGDGGRSSIWMHPGISLAYKFVDGRMPVLNPDWIDLLIRSANMPDGMTVSPEPLPASAGAGWA